MWPFKKQRKQEVPSRLDRFIPVGIRYFSRDIEVTDDLLEDYFNQLLRLSSSYTDEEIESLSNQTGFDIRRAFDFLPTGFARPKGVAIMCKFIRISNTDGLGPGPVEQALPLLSESRAFSRADIQSISERVGFDTFGRSEWKTITAVSFISDGRHIIAYRP